MTKWDYYVEPFDENQYCDDISTEMDKIGAEGWEAVGVLPPHRADSGFRVLYKRPAPVSSTVDGGTDGASPLS